MALRVTQQAIEVELAPASPALLVTQQVVEVELVPAAPALRVTQQVVEVEVVYQPPIQPTGIASRRAFGVTSVILVSGVIYPSGIASRRAFGALQMSQAQTVSPSGIARTRSLGTPAVAFPGLAQTISPTGIASRRAFGTAGVVSGGIQYLLPAGIVSRRRFGFPALVQVGAYIRPRVYIAGKNFRCAINPEISIQRRMGQRANANFRLMCPPGVSPTRPLVEQSVRITENGRILFSGFLNNIDEEVVTGSGYPDRTPFGQFFWDCQAVDLAVIADRRRVDKTYAAGPVRDIILDMAANFLSGENITSNYVLTTASIPAEQAFAKKTFAEAMNQLCGITGDIWGISALGDIFCYAPGDAPTSSFVVTSTNGTLLPGIKKKTSSIGLVTQGFIRSDQDLGSVEDLST